MARWRMVTKDGEQSFETEDAVLAHIKKELMEAIERTSLRDVVVIDPEGVRCDVHVNIRLEEQLYGR